MKKFFLPIFLFSFSTILFSQNYTQYVKPFVGTGGHGHTYPGATLPHGMVQLSPDTRIDGSWDGCSGYHYSDSVIYGFSHTHLSGTGCSDYGDIMLMPVTKRKTAFLPKEYASSFDHASEIATAGFYSVKLNDANVTANLTTTLRTGLHQYIFHENENAMMALDLNHRDEALDSRIEIINHNAVSGYRYSKAWATNQKIFFYIEFSRDFRDIQTMLDEKNEIISNMVTFLFDLKKNDTLLVKVGISGTSVEGAKLNLQTENPGWNFNGVKEKAIEAWNKELGKMDVVCEKKSDYEVFYTALYHTAVVPNIYNDVDGKYRGRDDKIHTKEEGNYYTVFSLWDTFRAAHPLYTLIDQERTKDYIETFIKQFEDGGRLPVWELSSNETECMIGVHSISVIADAVNKGLVDEKYKTVLADAMIATAKMWDYKGIGFMNTEHHLTIENESESVSKTLEYCYQYHCMALVCMWAGRTEEAYEFEHVSLGYKNLFDKDAGFFVPRANGGWLPNFDPTQVNNNYTEANGWQYTFFVPHDIKGMIELYGGKEKFHAKLDSLFGTSSKMTGREQADITGLIGQYAHGNEPSHHVAYLYNYIGDFSKTNSIVTKICNEFYTKKEDGLSGNEDCGQMSAWYVLSALGLYQVNPGVPAYTLTVPQVSSAKINLENGKQISIQKDDGFINSITWNGVELNRLYIEYDELMKGGELYFRHQKKQTLVEVVLKEGDILSTSSVFGHLISGSENYVAAPVITASEPIFKKETMVTISSANPNHSIFYEVRGLANDHSLKRKIVRYTKPFKIKSNCTVVAYAFNDKLELKSPTAIANLHKLPNNFTIDIKSVANNQYFAGGSQGLLDGVRGDVDWRKGNWHGYQGQDFEAVIDIKKPKKLRQITVSFLADNKSWIYYPIQIELYGSKNNGSFELINTLDKPFLGFDKPMLKVTGVTELVLNINDKRAYRYYKIKAINYGVLPEGHPGVGNPTFIFVDEIKFVK